MLRAGDRLVFVGVVESIVNLQRIKGLRPASAAEAKITASRLSRRLVEAVVSDTHPLVGLTIRDGRFRTKYDAAVIAVYRNGGRLHGRIGDIVLRAGDTLMLQAPDGFARHHRNNRDFLLVSQIDDRVRYGTTRRGSRSLSWLHDRASRRSSNTPGSASCMRPSLPPCCSSQPAVCQRVTRGRASTCQCSLRSWPRSSSGRASKPRASQPHGPGASSGPPRPFGPWAVLGHDLLLTVVDDGARHQQRRRGAGIPHCTRGCAGLGVSFLPFAVTVAIAASAGFAIPSGYQTHLMVLGPGGYRFSDFARMGVPLDLLCGVVTVTLAPLVYPF